MTKNDGFLVKFKKQYGNVVGDIAFSGHHLGISTDIAAYTLGAKYIERHFTIDRSMEGPDHAASLEPNELKLMISSLRNVEQALGDGKKTPSKNRKRIMNKF